MSTQHNALPGRLLAAVALSLIVTAIGACGDGDEEADDSAPTTSAESSPVTDEPADDTEFVKDVWMPYAEVVYPIPDRQFPRDAALVGGYARNIADLTPPEGFELEFDSIVVAAEQLAEDLRTPSSPAAYSEINEYEDLVVGLLQKLPCSGPRLMTVSGWDRVCYR